MTGIDLTLLLGIVARTTAVLLVALCATTLLRRASAATRHLVWTVALAGVLVLPFLGRVVPAWRVVPVPVELAPTRVAPEPVSPAQVPAEAAEAAAYAPAAAPAEEAPRTDWVIWIVRIWAAGGAILLARLAAGVIRIWWVERRSVELADAGWTSLTDGLARRLRLGRMVTLLRGEHASVPMTWGVVRPVVLLPAEADGWSEERRTVVLAHELAHIRRWDALTQWVAHFAVAVHWYNPLVWAAARRLRQEREQACDDAVLALGARPTVYADHLLEIVRSLGTASGPAAALAMARRSQFEGRLLAILDAAVPRSGVGRAVFLATLAGGAACILPLAALSPAERAGTVAAHAADAQHDEHPLPPAAPPVHPEAAEIVAPELLADLVEPPAGLPAIPDAPGALIGLLRGQPAADLYDDIIRMAAELRSPTEQRLVLDELMNRSDLRREHVIAIVEATSAIDSDTDRRLVLLRAATHPALGGAVAPNLAGALAHFSSPTEQRVVLAEVMGRLQRSPSALARVLRMTSLIDSDTEKRLVLASAAERFPIDGALRAAYMASVSEMESDTERRLALSALAAPAPAALAPAWRGLWDTVINLNGEHNGEPAFRLSLRASGVRLSRDTSDVVEVAPGGILGIAGVEGNGQTELVEAIVGLRPVAGGTIQVGGRDLAGLGVRERADAGLSHIPEDRHRRGLVLDYSVADNLIFGRQHHFARGATLDAARVARHAAEQVRAFDIRPPDPALPARALSGGNQQKIVIAREMGRDYAVLLAAQPTRGVDVGAIEFIHGQLRAARAAGKAVLLVSAELGELLALSDRIAVMYRGRIVAVLPRAEATEERLGGYMTGAEVAA